LDNKEIVLPFLAKRKKQTKKLKKIELFYTSSSILNY